MDGIKIMDKPSERMYAEYLDDKKIEETIEEKEQGEDGEETE